MAMDRCTIERLRGRMVLDSRGRPTVEAEVLLRGGCIGPAAAPSGASRGKHEAVELRDGDKSRFRGMGVNKAVYNINTVIADALAGLDARNQYLVDATMIELDGTPDKSMLGANATTAVSLAVAKAAACCSGLSLYRYLGGAGARTMPVPLMNVLNGGVHAGNKLDFQEFIIAPVGAQSFSEALRIGVEVYWALRDLLVDRYGSAAINVGDEGGFAPPMSKAEEALDALMEAIHLAGYTAGKDVVMGLDAAASQLYREADGKYTLAGRNMSREDMLEYYEGLLDDYPVLYLEDPLWEEDYDGFAALAEAVGGKTLVVGDDLYTTNVSRLARGLEKRSTNAVLVKV
ncbi:MAG: phosphopyruvate hydratase, partial [Candidatus Korarchaeota archaeon]|nr:phosphopyruvate hydratase [Candidatus Korarchaeota archaeon]